MAYESPKTKPDIDSIATTAVNDVEKMCAPQYMSKEQAKEFLELVIERLQSSVDVLEEDIAKEQS